MSLKKNNKPKTTTRFIVRAGVIGALYIALSFITFPVASGVLQFRLGEALTLLPLVFLESVPALAIGCVIFNVLSGLPLIEVLLGALVTLVAGVLTCGVGKLIRIKWLRLVLGGIFPILLNAFILPIIWVYCYGAGQYVYLLQVAFILAGEGLAVYLVGTPLAIIASRLKEKGII